MNELKEFIKQIRIDSLNMVAKAGASHIGTCLSCCDLLGTLYFDFLNISKENLNDFDRDFFIMSKGHGSAAIYATLANKGLIDKADLDEYCCDNAKLAGHITYKPNSGVELSSGSLGHGLPVAMGIARASKLSNRNNKIITLLSDGECQEGSNWEAFLMAPKMNLSNLLVIIDYNKFQGYDRTNDIVDFSNLKERFIATGWNAIEIDGHNLNEILVAYENFANEQLKPTIIVANTIKGKGVSYMENTLEWHYKCPNEEQLAQAISEVLSS